MEDERIGPRSPLPELRSDVDRASRIGGGPRADSRRRERDQARAFLDLEEGRGPVPVLDAAGTAVVLRVAHRIAIVGASSKLDRASNGVMRTLMVAGYECVPIHPREAEVNGVRAFATLDEAVAAGGPFDIVDVFRRSDDCVPHSQEAVRTGARCLWLQLGVVNWEAARIAHEGGLSVVMDRCTAIEWRRLAPDHPDVSR